MDSMGIDTDFDLHQVELGQYCKKHKVCFDEHGLCVKCTIEELVGEDEGVYEEDPRKGRGRSFLLFRGKEPTLTFQVPLIRSTAMLVFFLLLYFCMS